MADERLYSITEAAEKLGVSPATIATWIRLGIARASRQDELGRNRYTNADLVEMERRFQEREGRKGGGSPRPRPPPPPPRPRGGVEKQKTTGGGGRKQGRAGKTDGQKG